MKIMIIIIPPGGERIDEANSATETLDKSLKPSSFDPKPPKWLLITAAIFQILFFGLSFFLLLLEHILPK